MIDLTRQYAAERGVAADRFEFQMLYGIRRDLQAALAAQGYACASTFPSGASGSPISCAGSASGPPTSDLSFAAFSTNADQLTGHKSIVLSSSQTPGPMPCTVKPRPS